MPKVTYYQKEIPVIIKSISTLEIQIEEGSTLMDLFEVVKKAPASGYKINKNVTLTFELRSHNEKKL